MLQKIKRFIPRPIFEFFQPFYHYTLAILGASIYRFPGKKIVVIGVTGTKGKSTTVELVNSILEEAGFKTALLNTLRFKIEDKEKRNLFKMSMPGRFFIQKFLREAVNSGCEFAVIETTSEGAKQFRHKFLYLDALIFTNLAPEHIESHGSYKKYVEAKLSIAKELESPQEKFSRKVSANSQPKNFLKKCLAERSEETQGLFERNFLAGTAIIANSDDVEAEKFLALNIANKIPYSLKDAAAVKTSPDGSSFQVGKMVVHSKLPGIFNVSNMLGAIALARFFKIPDETIKKAMEKIGHIRGRMEKITVGNQPTDRFDVIVDYAHTPESLEAVYKAYDGYKKICVLGNTGGGRDKWKRRTMGAIADKYCDQIILTDEDPYDEDPLKIVEQMKEAVENKPLEIIMNRREAIASAITKAKEIKDTKVAVLITGKGTDPYIMGPNGSRQEWDDASVAREELSKILDNRS